MKFWQIGIGGVLIFLSACNALGSTDARATMLAEQTAYVEESTQVVATLNARSTEVLATSRAAETYVANVDGINRQLAVTLRAVNPPTQQIVDTSGLVTPGMIVNPGVLSAATAVPVSPEGGTPSSSGVNQMSQVSTAAGVRDSDGCANGTQTQFSAGATSIYLTGHMLNATSGTSVSAEWLYEGQLVTQNEPYTIAQDDPDFCVWFYIEPTDAPFSPGSWSARFLINGVPVEPVASFAIG